MQEKNQATVKKRLKWIAEYSKNKDIQGLSLFLGVTKERLYSWIKRNVVVDPDVILGKLPEINEQWLATGAGNPLSPGTPSVTINQFGTPTINATNCRDVTTQSTVEQASQAGANTMEVSERERQLLLGLREYFSPAEIRALEQKIEQRRGQINDLI